MATEKPKAKGSRIAWEAGRVARERGEPRDACPHNGDVSPIQRAWLQGWDSLGPVPDVRVAVPPVRTQETPAQKRVAPWFLPEGEALPTEHRMIRPHPCQACRRVYLDHMSQAVVVRTVFSGVAYLECRACDHRFKLPAR